MARLANFRKVSGNAEHSYSRSETRTIISRRLCDYQSSRGRMHVSRGICNVSLAITVLRVIRQLDVCQRSWRARKRVSCANGELTAVVSSFGTHCQIPGMLNFFKHRSPRRMTPQRKYNERDVVLLRLQQTAASSNCNGMWQNGSPALVKSISQF